MREVTLLNPFKKDFKNMIKRGKNPQKFEKVLSLLKTSSPLPEKYRDHKLTGSFKDWRDLHIEPDWVLIYKIDGNEIICAATGTHADLF
jgi:mRNA interferase YafQ